MTKYLCVIKTRKLQPIIIAGFGRSGTTWVSDIVSKTLGGLILFEPDHPCVFRGSQTALYDPNVDISTIQSLWINLYEQKNKNPWLLRNHLLSGVEFSNEIIEEIWSNSKAIGFKCIRWNHALPILSKVSEKKLIYVIRHPLAVVASLLNRPRFFLDFDWDAHWSLFKERNPLKEIDLKQYDHSEKSIKYAVMWSVSNIKALSDLELMDLPYWPYEEIYQKPYETSKAIMEYIGHIDARIHPSYLFYPSMSTLKTFHTDNEYRNYKNGDMNVFWNDTLDEERSGQIASVIQEIASQYPSAQKTFNDLKYLTV